MKPCETLIDELRTKHPIKLWLLRNVSKRSGASSSTGLPKVKTSIAVFPMTAAGTVEPAGGEGSRCGVSAPQVHEIASAAAPET